MEAARAATSGVVATFSPTFATVAESSLDTFPELASLTFNDLENVAFEHDLAIHAAD